MTGSTGRAERRFFRLAAAALCAIGAALWSSAAFAQGIFVPSVGPVNQSMSGAATAAPIDSIGALAWNPAAIAGLPGSEAAFGLGLVLPTTALESRIDALNFGGSTDSEPGVCPVPTVGFAHHVADSNWTIGLGIFGVGGFSANYPASTTNPILTPQPTAANPLGGLGQIFAHAEIYQIAPTLAYSLSERFSVGFAPTVTLSKLQADPNFLSPPNDADGDGVFRYGSGVGTRMAWGGGFQVGAYYVGENCWNWGLSYRSQQWMEPFRFNSQDELGLPTFSTVRIDLPSIVSLGLAYVGYERWLFATDLRYFDYANATGFGDQGFRADGSVAGLGWKSVLSVSQGVQFVATDKLILRGGYTYNQNPISSEQAMFNVASSLIIQHWASVGATYYWCPWVSTTLAYTHGFENSVTGPFQSPMGPVDGTSVTERVSADILNFGVTVSY